MEISVCTNCGRIANTDVLSMANTYVIGALE